MLFLQGTKLDRPIPLKRRAEETKEAVDSLLLMGEWFAFGAGDMGNTCALRSSVCQNAPFLFLFLFTLGMEEGVHDQNPLGSVMSPPPSYFLVDLLVCCIMTGPHFYTFCT